MIHSFPRYNLMGIRKNKITISGETANSISDCDNMFFPDFIMLAKYVNKKINKRKKARTDSTTYGE